MTKRESLWSGILLLLSLGMCVLMPSSDSLWIDEAQTWKSAAIPKFGDWFQSLLTNPFSEALMPLGMLVAWVSAKIIGTSEWQLRAINILWSGLGVIAFWRVGRILRAPWAPLLFAVQPFVWFYANEARPYSLQMACGAWLLAGMVTGVTSGYFSMTTLVILSTAGVVLVGSTLFGVITFAPVVLILLIYKWQRKAAFSRSWPWIGSTVLCICLAFAFYYAAALQRGAEGARLWSPGLSNVAFSMYEFFGLSGLGAPREQLREIAQTGGAVQLFREVAVYLPAQLLLTASLCAVLAIGFKAISRTEARLVYATSTLVTGLVWVATLLLAFIAGFPFWGRHLAPSFPFFIGALLGASTTAHVRLSGTQAKWGLIATLILLPLLSGARLRFSDHYRKDDYRSAAKLAVELASQGQTIWWAADPDAATYYGVHFAPENEKSGILLIRPENLSALPMSHPQVIIMSKPDIYDRKRLIREHISRGAYRLSVTFRAFNLWQAPT